MYLRDVKLGITVEVSMGLDRGRRGVVVNKRLVKTDGRGIPDLGKGHFKPMGRKDVAIQYDDGTLDVFDHGVLIKV